MTAPILATTFSVVNTMGRPRGGFRGDVDWHLAERLFISGESGADEGAARFPSLAEIGRRIGTAERPGVSAQAVWKYSRAHGWPARREAAQRGDVPTPAPGSTSRLAAPQGAASAHPPNAKKRTGRDPESVLLRYIEQFADAVASGSVRHDSVADLDRAVRLLAFARGQSESLRTVNATISLESMQQRHAQVRAMAVAMVDDQVAGVLGQGSPGEVVEEASPTRGTKLATGSVAAIG